MTMTAPSVNQTLITLPRAERRALRVAVLAPPWITVPPPGYGGIEAVVALLCEGLVAKGHDVTLFAAPGSRSAAQVCSPLRVRTRMRSARRCTRRIMSAQAMTPSIALELKVDPSTCCTTTRASLRSRWQIVSRCRSYTRCTRHSTMRRRPFMNATPTSPARRDQPLPA